MQMNVHKDYQSWKIPQSWTMNEMTYSLTFQGLLLPQSEFKLIFKAKYVHTHISNKLPENISSGIAVMLLWSRYLV